jgi:hypothetical protein
MVKTIHTPTNREVIVIHHGFDIAIVEFEGKQELVKVSETTLIKRDRPKIKKYRY